MKMAVKMEGKKETATVGAETLISLESVIDGMKNLVDELEEKLRTICSSDAKVEDAVPNDRKLKEIPEYFNVIRTQSDKISDINNKLESLLHRIEL